MRRVVVDTVLVVALVLVGLAVTGNLNGPGGLVFVLVLGLVFAVVRWLSHRARRTRAS